jgi:fatty-acyl-CoA synthase
MFGAVKYPSEFPTLGVMLDRWARARPRKPALRYGDTVVTYRGLSEAAGRLTKGLSELGFQVGDRLALWLPDTPAYLALVFACARLGVITVAVNTRYRAAEVGDIVERSGARGLVYWPEFHDIGFNDILDDVERSRLGGLEYLIAYDEDPLGDAPAPSVLDIRTIRFQDLLSQRVLPEDKGRPDTPSNIFTTSGTTKAPKFVLHWQQGIVDHARAAAIDFGMGDAGTVTLQAVPLCGVFGFSQAMATLAAGRPLILMPSFDARVAAEIVRRRKVTHMCGSDDMFAMMLEARNEPQPFPSLRLCGFANFNPARENFVAEGEARGLPLIGLYGMSEVQALYARQRLEADIEQRRLGGGFPVSEAARVRVRDPESGQILAHGEQGELELTGPSLMIGYFENPEATAETIDDEGYVHSGDLGYTLEDGSFVFLARMGDALRLGGFLVSPAEIEAEVQAVPGIEGCQVVGVTMGGKLRSLAFVTLAPGTAFDEPAAIEACAARMAKFKVPARIVPLDAFPTTKSPNGIKIQKAKLREMAATHAEAAGAAQ